MLNIYAAQPQGLARVPLEGNELPERTVWIDLLVPTQEEEKSIESILGVDVPTREEMKEIETSNRLYEDEGALYMTATITAKLDTDAPESTAITFILVKNRLVTNRYVDTKPFQLFTAYAEKHPQSCTSPLMVLAGLVESNIQRIADVLERIGADLDAVSASIFARNGSATPASDDLRGYLERIGFNGELDSKARESLVSLGRLLAFVQQSSVPQMTQDQRSRFRSISRDALSLSDHATFLGTKVQFLLDSTLGLINVEQNNIIKIFSVAAMVFLPPTLIASIYGMNFRWIPELTWHFGYPFALVMMVLSAVIPYLWFKRKKWL